MNRDVTVISPQDLSIPGLFAKRVELSPNEDSYHFFDHRSGCWQTLSWIRMEERVSLWRTAFAGENFEPGDRVAIMLPNCLEWTCFDLAAQSLGLVVVPLYANDRPDNVSYILQHTGSRLLLCPDQEFWTSLCQTGDRLDKLQRVLVKEDSGISPGDSKLMPMGEWLPKRTGKAAATLPGPDDLATIVYTSGTTGRPKGVMLSHRNILENAFTGLQCSDICPDDVFLSFLPLSHMLERTAGYYLPMMAGASVAYARSIQDLSKDLANVRPTVLVAVPRIFERLYSKISIQVSKQSAFTQALFKKACDTGWRRYLHTQSKAGWSADFILHPLLNTLVGKKIREKLGGRLRVVISGGAPLPTGVARTLIGLGIPIYQGYGLTETSPIISVNRMNNNRIDSVGELLPGIEAKISENGELLVRGSCVMQGYWKNPEATAEAIDHEGWLHTGDIAEYDGTHLKITGRLKDILVMSNSEKISPTDIETAIAADPLFEQSMIVGEGRPYLTLLAVLNPELWVELARELDLPPEDDSLSNELVRSEIMRRIEQCLRSFPGFAWVRNICLSLKPWTVEQGYLTPTLKLKRKNILDSMHDEVERMYQT